MSTDNKNKKENAASLRHDLKNKLAIVQGYSELLLTKLNSEKEIRWAKEILIASKELYEMIDKKVR